MKVGNITDYAVEMKQITKRFPGVLANDKIDLQIEKGKIHTLLGENGAGKSTLMNILYGLYTPDEGEIIIDGELVTMKSPLDAIHHKIGMVHQHFTLVDSFTAAQNIHLGTIEYRELLKDPKKLLVDNKKMTQEVDAIAQKFRLDVHPHTKVWQLSAGERQRVEILKALYRGINILILDEPTSVLAPHEVEDFFKTLKHMNQQGLTVLFITHILDEAKAISDKITVLKDGKKMATLEGSKPTKKDLARLMVGRDVLFTLKREPIELGDTILEVKNLSAMSDRRLPVLKNISFKIRSKEIFGLAGVAGNGQKELHEVISGLRKATSGEFTISGENMVNKGPLKVIQKGLVCIPEERLSRGVILDFTVKENSILTRFAEPRFSERLLLKWDEVEKHTNNLVKEYDIKISSIDDPVRNLSGGNIQKLILARELSKNPKLIVAVHPTMGLDVGATEFIRKQILEARKRGSAILFISENLDELLNLSDTIAVMYKGEIVSIVSADAADKEKIGLHMTGG